MVRIYLDSVVDLDVKDEGELENNIQDSLNNQAGAQNLWPDITTSPIGQHGGLTIIEIRTYKDDIESYTIETIQDEVRTILRGKNLTGVSINNWMISAERYL